jgi:hypothetical protein
MDMERVEPIAPERPLMTSLLLCAGSKFVVEVLY